MNPSVLTLLLFVASLDCGAVAHHKAAGYGSAMPAAMRHLLRGAFAVCVFLGVWGSLTYALWLAGVPLKIGTIERGIMGEQWWLGPFCLIWAGLAYTQLRRG